MSRKKPKQSAVNESGLMICRGVDCPYRAVCDVPNADLESAVNSPCSKEVAFLSEQFIGYCAELGIEGTDAADTEQVRQLVDIELKLIRCSKFTALNPDLVCADDSGRQQVHPIALYELKLMRQHGRLLKNLVAAYY